MVARPITGAQTFPAYGQLKEGDILEPWAYRISEPVK